MPLGVHTSIAGGLYKSVERAKALGCGCMQIFGRNPRSWISLFRRMRQGFLRRQGTTRRSGLLPSIRTTS